jgi:hypothetical protein
MNLDDVAARIDNMHYHVLEVGKDEENSLLEGIDPRITRDDIPLR